MLLNIDDDLFGETMMLFQDLERGCHQYGIDATRWKTLRKRLKKAMFDAVAAELGREAETPALLRRQAG